MLEIVDHTTSDTTLDRSRTDSESQSSAPHLQAFSAGDYLYRQASTREAAYRVEQGVVAVFRRNISRPSEIVGIAIEGDFVGLGSFEQHGDNARAIVSTIVTTLGRREIMALFAGSSKLRRMHTEAVEREFESRKEFLAHRSRANPVSRVAGFLLWASSQNEHDGLDPTVVTDVASCGVVSEYLGMDIDGLAAALVKLERLAVVEVSPPSGLRLTDLIGLEQVADGEI